MTPGHFQNFQLHGHEGEGAVKGLEGAGAVSGLVYAIFPHKDGHL